jgi:formylglycine-generating enzyme required for sulfatase activity
MRKLLLGLGIAAVAVSAFAQGTSYVAYQGKLKGQVSPADGAAIAKYGDNVVLVVDTASDAAMMVRYGKDKATGPWVKADITTYRQDEKALNGKDDVQAGYLLSWYFVTPEGEHVRLVGQTKTADAGFDWAAFFAASTKWPKLQGALAGQTSQRAAYASTSLKPLAALSQEMNAGDAEAVLAAFLVAKSKADAQDVADEIAPFFPGATTEYLVVDLFTGTCTELTSVPADLMTDSSYKTTKMVFRRIPAGTFTMGSTGDELGRWADREFQHQVTLTQDFHIGIFEVTQAQYFMVMGTWPSYFENLAWRVARPVEEVSWETVRGGVWPGAGGPAVGTFMDKLRTLTGGVLPFDLPTEAQWEYACRAGTITALNSGQNLTAADQCPNMAQVGRYYYNGGSDETPDGDLTVGSAAVGSSQPNAWGLYDMHGNVWEWCLDVYVADLGTDPVVDPIGGAASMFRVSRGGSWIDPAEYCRSAMRNQPFQGLTENYHGFRVAIQPE